jgi:hypothetical protein
VVVEATGRLKMDQKLTNRQILSRLQAEFRGWRVEMSRHGDAFELTAPNGKLIRRRFDEVRNPVALQAAIAQVRKSVGRS